MIRKYLITSNPFDGVIQGFVDDGIVQHTGEQIRTETVDERGVTTIDIQFVNGLTPEEYANENGFEYFRVVDKDEMERLFKSYEESHLTDWVEISEEDYNHFLEVLPPVRYNGTFFFVQEAYIGNIHRCCYKKGGKFYSSKRRINEPTRSIQSSIKNIQ